MSMTGDDFDLEAELNAALDGEQKPQEQAPEAEAPENETPAEEQARYVREGRRFVKEQKEEQEPAAAKEQAEQPKPAKVWRPNWYKDEYGPWDTLPENFRNALRDQERAAAQGIEKASTSAKAWEPVLEALKPFEQQMRASSLSPQQYIGGLVEADKYLRQDPVQAINWLCGQYLGSGWDVRALADWMDQRGVEPQKVDPVQQELAALKQELQSLKALPQQQAREATAKQIADWSRDKPDFDAVRDRMAVLAKRNPEASLDDLYEEARWADPTIRERLLQEREDKRIAELKGKRAAGAQSPRGGQTNGAARNQRPTMSLEDEIAMHLDGGV